MNTPNEIITDDDEPQSYVIQTGSGTLWLIELADSESEALAQYYEGDAEPHVSIRPPDDDDEIEYLRDMGQAS